MSLKRAKYRGMLAFPKEGEGRKERDEGMSWILLELQGFELTEAREVRTRSIAWRRQLA